MTTFQKIALFFLILASLYYFTNNKRQKCKCQQPYVGDSPIAGKGVFATKAYSAGEIVDQCTTIAVPAKDVLDKNRIQDYVFKSTKADIVLAPLGNCGLFNHANDNNCTYKINKDDTIHVFALHDIARGTELTVNYGDAYWTSRGLSPL